MPQSDPWDELATAVSEALDWIWSDFVKEGSEGAVLGPLAAFPIAATWVAGSLALSDDYVCRKIGAMLAGFIDIIDIEGNSTVLTQMLDRERARFATDPLEANSVGEDIMFAATRWTLSDNPHSQQAGVDILSEMVRDALEGTAWNTSHWAAANLLAASGPDAPAFTELLTAPEDALANQTFLLRFVNGFRAGDDEIVRGCRTVPSAAEELTAGHSRHPDAQALWQAARRAQDSL